MFEFNCARKLVSMNSNLNLGVLEAWFLKYNFIYLSNNYLMTRLSKIWDFTFNTDLIQIVYKRVRPVNLISLSFKWVILTYEINKVES